MLFFPLLHRRLWRLEAGRRRKKRTGEIFPPVGEEMRGKWNGASLVLKKWTKPSLGGGVQKLPSP